MRRAWRSMKRFGNWGPEMKFHRFLLVALGIALSVIDDSRADPVSLADAIRIALKNSPGFDVAEKTQTVNDLQYRNAIAKLLPSLDFTTTDGLQKNIPVA